MNHLPIIPGRHGQRGLTLAELLIAMAISMIMLSAASMVFTQTQKLQTELDKTNRLIDNGRYALDLLADNLSMAGFFGEYGPERFLPPPAPQFTTYGPGDSESLADFACRTDFSASNMLSQVTGLHVQGINAPNLTTPPTKPSCIPSTETLAPGSDILIIRRTATTQTSLASITGNTAWYVQSSLCQHDDPDKALLKNVAASMTLRQRDCTPTSTVPYAVPRQLVVELYFVAANNEGTDGVPTLKKVELLSSGSFSSPVPLVEGIEYLQVAYGLDTPIADGGPDSFSDCNACTRHEWSSVVSVKVWLLARNLETTNSATDTRTYDLGPAGTLTPPAGVRNYRRQLFTRTVRLVNSAERIEK